MLPTYLVKEAVSAEDRYLALEKDRNGILLLSLLIVLLLAKAIM